MPPPPRTGGTCSTGRSGTRGRRCRRGSPGAGTPGASTGPRRAAPRWPRSSCPPTACPGVKKLARMQRDEDEAGDRRDLVPPPRLPGDVPAVVGPSTRDRGAPRSGSSAGHHDAPLRPADPPPIGVIWRESVDPSRRGGGVFCAPSVRFPSLNARPVTAASWASSGGCAHNGVGRGDVAAVGPRGVGGEGGPLGSRVSARAQILDRSTPVYVELSASAGAIDDCSLIRRPRTAGWTERVVTRRLSDYVETSSAARC